jgi:hypothetical protein
MLALDNKGENMKAIIATFLVILLIGCSTKNPKPQVDNSPIYKLIAIAETELSNQGDTCADATGTIRLYKNGIFGSARDTFSRGFKITGKISASGEIAGGFALSIVTAVDFKGQLDADKKHANGTWKDVYECQGIWKATKVI